MAYLTMIPLSEIDNYIQATETQIWGINSKKNKEIKIKEGDKILFIIGMNYQGGVDDTTPPKGFPLLKSYRGLPIGIEAMWKCKVKSEPKIMADAPLDGDYDLFFEIESIEETFDFPLDNLHDDLVEAIRKLFVKRKRYAKLDDHLFEKPIEKLDRIA